MATKIVCTNSLACRYEPRHQYEAAGKYRKDLATAISNDFSKICPRKLIQHMDSYDASDTNAVKHVALALRSLQARRGTRYLVNSGVLLAFIHFCGKANRFDYAKRAFNIIAVGLSPKQPTCSYAWKPFPRFGPASAFFALQL